MTTTAPITINGSTREVEINERAGVPGRVFVPGVVATIGRGSARYPDVLTLWLVVDGKVHAGNRTAIDSDGRTWQYHLSTCVRNRQARIVGWRDEKGATNLQGQDRVGQ